MSVAMEATEVGARKWKSPTRKLVEFFHGSRNRWKAKCQELRSSRKRMINQVRAVEESRKKWATRAEQAEERISELERELEGLKRFRTA